MASRLARLGVAPAIIDKETVQAIKDRRFDVVAAVERLDSTGVELADGSRIEPDAVIAATGYRTGLEPMVGHLGVLDEHGKPRVRSGEAAPGLRFIGYIPRPGQIGRMGMEAAEAADSIAPAERLATPRTPPYRAYAHCPPRALALIKNPPRTGRDDPDLTDEAVRGRTHDRQLVRGPGGGAAGGHPQRRASHSARGLNQEPAMLPGRRLTCAPSRRDRPPRVEPTVAFLRGADVRLADLHPRDSPHARVGGCWSRRRRRGLRAGWLGLGDFARGRRAGPASSSLRRAVGARRC